MAPGAAAGESIVFSPGGLSAGLRWWSVRWSPLSVCPLVFSGGLSAVGLYAGFLWCLSAGLFWWSVHWSPLVSAGGLRQWWSAACCGWGLYSRAIDRSLTDIPEGRRLVPGLAMIGL